MCWRPAVPPSSSQPAHSVDPHLRAALNRLQAAQNRILALGAWLCKLEGQLAGQAGVAGLEHVAAWGEMGGGRVWAGTLSTWPFPATSVVGIIQARAAAARACSRDSHGAAARVTRAARQALRPWRDHRRRHGRQAGRQEAGGAPHRHSGSHTTTISPTCTPGTDGSEGGCRRYAEGTQASQQGQR